MLRHSFRLRTAEVFSQKFQEKTSRRGSRRIYGVGDVAAGDSVVAGDSIVEAGLAVSVIVGGLVAVIVGGLVAVVVGGLVAAGLAAGSVVSVFCSHAARSAALARMQMYLFIVFI